MEEIKQCTYYRTGRKCMNKKYCPEQAGVDNCMSYRYYAKDLELQLKRKEKECEELKEQVEYLQNFNIEQNEAYTFMNNLHWSNEDLEKVKYKQALQKIKEIVQKEENNQWYCNFNCNSCVNKCLTGQILQKISEVEE